jgi:formylglycine-generating enzyme required for sulfatase activity
MCEGSDKALNRSQRINRQPMSLIKSVACAILLLAFPVVSTAAAVKDAASHPAQAPASNRSTGGSAEPRTAPVGPHDNSPMVLVHAGEFAMGSDRGQDDEQPVHRISVRAFYLDTYEVTVSRYAEFLTSQKPDSPFKWNEATGGAHENKPVIGVNWYDARDYCRWVGKRLPTEAEWEMAARGTEGRIYPWGDVHPTKGHANAGQAIWRGYETLTNIGRYQLGKTPDGLYDMAGNLWEWVADWYDPSYYHFSPSDNPRGPSAGPLRALRGGAWNNDSKAIRSTNRAAYAPDARRNDVGFRCAREAKSGGR